jgi:hypothetical protein
MFFLPSGVLACFDPQWKRKRFLSEARQSYLSQMQPKSLILRVL